MRNIKGTKFPDNLLMEMYSCFVSPIPNDNQLSQDQLDGLDYAIKTLSEREQHVVKARYKELKTYEVIGKELGLQKETIRHYIGTACRKLGHPVRLNQFKYGLNGYKEELKRREMEASK